MSATAARDARTDPALGFWLRYVEAEGALTEDGGDHAVALLPVPTREEFGLPEVVTVTADPEVAREDGALLLAPGHPVLDGAADRVVERGDAGCVWLDWPNRPRVETAVLAQRAREQIAADHGRVDRDGEAAEVWLPLLRVGAVLRVSASLDLRFQERLETWVDARTGLEIPAGLRDAVSSQLWSERPDHRRRALRPDLARALPAAQRLLADRAAQRTEALARQADDLRADELERVEAYYRAALDTIERRAQKAEDAERRGLLDAQAEATRAELERRRREVSDLYRPRHEQRPFRVHLVLVPAMRVPVLVRRGARTYPLEIVWVLSTGAFAPVACPHCGSGEPLVAGRERLGCAACLGRTEPSRQGGPPEAAAPRKPAAAPAPAGERPAASVQRPAAAGERPVASGRNGAAGRTAPARRPSSAPRRVPTRRKVGDRATSARTSGQAPPDRVRRVGDRLALRFWQEVSEGRRWHKNRVAADSPLRTLHRLFGPQAPLVAVGLGPGEVPSKIDVFTADPEPGWLPVTGGALHVGALKYPFTLRWEQRATGPVLLELLPGLHARDGMLPPRYVFPPAVGERLFGPAEVPSGLDPVASSLWSVERGTGGLPLVLRCLTAWSRANELVGPGGDPPTLAAAIASLVASRSGLRRSRAMAASDYGADPEAVAQTAKLLQGKLKLSTGNAW